MSFIHILLLAFLILINPCCHEGGALLLSIVYFYFPKYGGVYWFKGPIRTSTSVEGDNDVNAEKGIIEGAKEGDESVSSQT